MKFNLNGWKKISSDEHHTTLRDESGHELKVAHSKLSPHHARALSMLPQKMADDDAVKMDEGGVVQAPKKDRGPRIDADKAKEIQSSAMESGWQPERWKKNLKAAVGYADGGEVALDDAAAMGIPEEDTSVMQQPPEQPAPAEMSPEPTALELENEMAPTAADASQPPEEPIQYETPESESQPAPIQTAVNPNHLPSTEEGFSQGLQGINQQATAESRIAARTADILQHKAQVEQNLAVKADAKRQELIQEGNNLLQDMKEGHIDPNHYLGEMSTPGKISTLIGLVLGGIGSSLSHTENASLKLFNAAIERDVEAQKANLGQKNSLFSVNLQQYKNVQDATDATKLQLAHMTDDQLQQAAAKQGTPIAKARAQQASAALAQQYGPVLNQLATRRALLDEGRGQPGQPVDNNFSNVDPSLYVSQVVPPEHQKEVFDSIKAAQNTNKMRDHILKAFDQAASDMSGIGGNVLSRVKTPRSVGALHTFMGPTFADTEGTVRQAAMDNVFGGITPSPNDTDKDIKLKRQALEGYLHSKGSAPTAKGYGIDLQKFASTSSNPVAGFTPQQKSVLQWAKANPTHPAAQIALKKLGVE